MTRLLFLPDDQSFLMLESRLTPAALVKAVANGIWQPPEPYPSALAENPGDTLSPKLCAFHLGRMVVVIPEPPQAEEQGMPSTLSPRQQQVLYHMACGLNTKQIASRLQLTSRAVLFHIATLKARLKAASRPELIRKAVEMGLLEKGSLNQRS